MPRIDPIQLLNCLSVLLSPEGGIRSTTEVNRLAKLMMKFSKKLVSKCIYIQILKCTETELLGLFMSSGGWQLVHMWLTESIVAKNWPLVKELLELLLLCPVDIDRLKTNNCPKLVKQLSKDGNLFAIRTLASKLVEQWLKTVKGENVILVKSSELSQILSESQIADVQHDQNDLNNMNILDKKLNISQDGDQNLKKLNIKPETDKKSTCEIELANENFTKMELNNKKSTIINSNELEKQNSSIGIESDSLSIKDSEQAISLVEHESDSKEPQKSVKDKECKDTIKSKDKSHDKSSSSSRSSKSSSSKNSSRSHSSSKDKHKNHKSSSSINSDSPSRHNSSKEKSKEKDKHISNSSKSSNSSSKKSSSTSSSSKSKDDKHDRKHTSDKDKRREKEKMTENSSKQKSDDQKLIEETQKTPSIHKLGKIPKLSDVKKEKPSISIEVRKPEDPKPKTVKTFHSKFRKHGLEEEIKPPPSRASILNKKPPIIPPTISLSKRSSPVHDESPPEKKQKTIEVDKPGAIKLIPPKPKQMMLLESDMFMDALNASATNVKKEPKKRKRRMSGSKESSTDGSPPNTPTTVTSPTTENKSVPPKFYQDTLDIEEEKEKSIEKSPENKETTVVTKTNNVNEKDDSMDTSEPHTLTINGLKGVLVYHKKKGPKKSIKWKPDIELEEIKYFELDETERVNVTKTFTDMKHLERIHEREAFQKARNLINDDVMEERTSWRPPIPIDIQGQIHVDYGKNSKEKDVQAIRQKGTLQSLYFHKATIPDSPLEPDSETHPYAEPVVIPLEDVTGNQDTTTDFRNMPWPEPKGNAPPPSSNANIVPLFPPQFPNGFPGAQFPPGVPGFQGPMVPGEWPNVPPNMLPNGLPMQLGPPGMPPGPMPPSNMPPGMIAPPENMMMNPEMFGAQNSMFPVPDGFNMPPNMFPPDFNMSAGPPQVPPGPEGFPGSEGFPGPVNFRGNTRGRGPVGHWRGKNNREGPIRGRGRGGRKAMCIYFQRKGSCRQGDNCSFLHPGVNGPY